MSDRPRCRNCRGWIDGSCGGATGLHAALVHVVRAIDDRGESSGVSSTAGSIGTGFYQSPLDIPLDKFELAFDSQVRAFHLLVRGMVNLLADQGGGRIIAISYSPSGRTGSWQPWCAMGAAKAAPDALAGYYAVALAARGVTVNIVSPGATEDSVLSRLPPIDVRIIQ